MQIRRLLLAFFSAGLGLALVTLALAFLLERDLLEVERAQDIRHQSYVLADELRQSSDDLTRFARTYVVTSDDRYKQYFNRVIEIRDGTIPRPRGYEGIYWDLVVGGQISEPATEGADSLSLESRMLEASFTVEEFSKLKEAQNKSDELIGLENVAIGAVEGRFDDGTGSFATPGEPNPELATSLLHGERYHAAKAKIMKPIGDFLAMVDQRTARVLDELNKSSYLLLIGILGSTVALVASLGAMMWTLQRRLIKRTDALVQTANEVTNGNLEARSGVFGKDELGALGTAFDAMVARLSVALEDANNRTRESEEQRSELEIERNRSEKLLHNILPAVIASRLKDGESGFAETYPEVTVLFADIVGFTKLSQKLGPRQIVSMLNDVFACFDEITLRTHVEKIKTIGDCYMVVSGVPDRRSTHCQEIANFSLEAMEAFREYAKDFGEPLQIRMGMHTGTVVAGIVGTQKFSFDLWGDVVNVASRLESTGVPDRIHVSDAVQIRLADDFLFEARGMTDMKGKGSLHTWFLQDRKHVD